MPTSSLKWFAVSGAFESYADKRLAKLYEQIILLEAIPLAFALTDESHAAMLSQVHGIQRVGPIAKSGLKVIAGLERLLYDGRAAWNTPQPNGWAYEVPSLPNDPDGANKLPYYPDFRIVEGRFRRVLDTSTILQTRLGFMAAVSLSLQAPRGEVFDPEDPFNVATRAASKFVPIVIAAGNYHEPMSSREGTMSAWAQASWVISVGATDSEDGGKLASVSSRGSPDREFSGPTVVAWGRSLTAPSDVGIRTSFATPRIAAALCYLGAYCLTLRHFVQLRLSTPRTQIEGIPLTGFGMIDDGCDDSFWERPQKLPALPRQGVDVASLAEVLQLVRTLGSEVRVWPTPDTLRHMLLECAQPLRGYRSHEVGHGFVSSDSVAQYLLNFTGADFIRLFCVGKSVPEDLERRLRKIRLTDGQSLPYLLTIWEQSRRRWFFPIVKDSHMIQLPTKQLETFDSILDETKDLQAWSLTGKVTLMHPASTHKWTWLSGLAACLRGGARCKLQTVMDEPRAS
jgi:hypothetical protein